MLHTQQPILHTQQPMLHTHTQQPMLQTQQPMLQTQQPMGQWGQQPVAQTQHIHYEQPQPVTQNHMAPDTDDDPDDTSLRSVKDLPATFHSVFTYRYFNPMQSECWPTVYGSSVNAVISAPTGSGKTGAMAWWLHACVHGM